MSFENKIRCTGCLRMVPKMGYDKPENTWEYITLYIPVNKQVLFWFIAHFFSQVHYVRKPKSVPTPPSESQRACKEAAEAVVLLLGLCLPPLATTTPPPPPPPQQQQQQQRSDPSSARAFAFLFPLRIALKRVLSLTAGSVFFISAHASQVL